MRKKGISLITLIITIIVIIILASIVIFSGLNTPDRAGFAKFVSELEDVQTYVTNQIANVKGENIIKGTVKSNAQLVYMIATGSDGSSVPASPTPAGTIASLGKTILPEGLTGTNYYEITNSDVLPTTKSFYQTGEKHYITDKGEVFIWPGYKLEEDGTSKWYISHNKYYIGEGSSVATGEKLGDTLVVGDYVTYAGDSSNSYTLDADLTGYNDDDGTRLTPESATWRVWKVKDNGEVVIMPVNPLHDFYLSGKDGFINSLDILEAVCDLYTNSTLGVTASAVESLTIEDLLAVSNIDAIKEGYNYQIDDYGSNFNVMNTYTEGTFYTEEDGVTINKSGRIASSTNPITVRNTAYWTNYEITWNALGSKFTGETYGSLLGENYSRLASPCVLVYSENAYFGVRSASSEDVGHNYYLYGSDGNEGDDSYGVRPLVSLSSTLHVASGNGSSGSPYVLSK